MTRGSRLALLSLGAGAYLWIGVKAVAQVTGTGGAPLTPAQIAALAPVQSVNGAQGQVAIPTVQRQVSAAIDISSGTVTWTYPIPFAHSPTCWPTVGPSNSSYVFAQPTISATVTTATANEQAALKSLSLPLGLTTFWVNPPSGTTITLSCVGALP